MADAVINVCAVLRDFFRKFRNPVAPPGSTTRETRGEPPRPGAARGHDADEVIAELGLLDTVAGMSLSSLATTFRPARFDDVIGQRHVKVPLRQALASNRLPQQLLFVGGSGLGKTTLARIVAGSLLCPNRDADTSDACGTCESCTALAAGNHPDVIEFDAASHGQKDNMVELARRATLAPMLSTHRVFIIDEAHGLNRHLAPSGAGEVDTAHLRIDVNNALEG